MFAVFGVAMFVGVFYIGNALENKVSTLFLQIICGMLIYGTFCVIYFVHTKDEMILKMLRGIKEKSDNIWNGLISRILLERTKPGLSTII